MQLKTYIKSKLGTNVNLIIVTLCPVVLDSQRVFVSVSIQPGGCRTAVVQCTLTICYSKASDSQTMRWCDLVTRVNTAQLQEY